MRRANSCRRWPAARRSARNPDRSSEESWCEENSASSVTGSCLGLRGRRAVGGHFLADWPLRPAGFRQPGDCAQSCVRFCRSDSQVSGALGGAAHVQPGGGGTNGMVDVLYRAEDDTGAMQIGMHTSRLGLAESADGIHFTRRPTPVFYPADDGQNAREWPGGVEDPRIVEREDGTYVLTYTQWNRVTYSVGIATSRDLEHWTKYGPAFLEAEGGKYANLKYKSAGIVTALRDGRLIAARIEGKYWMYWGEGAIHLATSSDLIRWTPVEDAKGEPIEVLRPRPGRFDSSFPETGPPPVLTRRGIVVIYNGKNAASGGDPQSGRGYLCSGRVAVRCEESRAAFGTNGRSDTAANAALRKDRPIQRRHHVFRRPRLFSRSMVSVLRLRRFPGRCGYGQGNRRQSRKVRKRQGSRLWISISGFESLAIFR